MRHEIIEKSLIVNINFSKTFICRSGTVIQQLFRIFLRFFEIIIRHTPKHLLGATISKYYAIAFLISELK